MILCHGGNLKFFPTPRPLGAGTVRVDVGVGRSGASWSLSDRAEKPFTSKSCGSNIYRLIRCREANATLRWEIYYLISSQRTLRIISRGDDTHQPGFACCELNGTSRVTHGGPWERLGLPKLAPSCSQGCIDPPHSLERMDADQCRPE